MKDSLFYLLMNNAQLAKRIVSQNIPVVQEGKSYLPMALLSRIDKEGNTLVELTQRLQCSKQETTRQVQLAESKGWVVCQVSEVDKRSKIVTLTDHALEQFKQGQDLYAQLEVQLLEGLTQEQGQLLIEGQVKLQSLLKEFAV